MNGAPSAHHIGDSEKRINDLLTLTNTLRQENHNVKEEIFDLKMCMATSQVESTASIMKELNALKSQLAFKEREMQELQNEASQSKRKLDAMSQQNSNYDTSVTKSSKTQHTTPPQRDIQSGNARDTTPAVMSKEIDKVVKETKEKCMEELAARRKRDTDTLQRQKDREMERHTQLKLQKEHILQFCQQVSNVVSVVGDSMNIVSVALSSWVAMDGGVPRSRSGSSGSAHEGLEGGRKAGQGVLSRLQILLHPLVPVLETQPTTATSPSQAPSTAPTPRTPHTQDTSQPIISTQKQADARTPRVPTLSTSWHKYCTSPARTAKPLSQKLTRTPTSHSAGPSSGRRRRRSSAGNISPFVPLATPLRGLGTPLVHGEASVWGKAEQTVDRIAMTLADVRRCLHSVSQQVITGQLFASYVPPIQAIDVPQLTSVDLLLYSLTHLGQLLVELSSRLSTLDDSDQYIPSGIIASNISESDHQAYFRQLKLALTQPEDVVHDSLVKVVTTVRMLLKEFSFRLPPTPGSPKQSDPRDRKDTRTDAIVSVEQLSLISLGDNFRRRCIEGLCDISEHGFDKRDPRVIQTSCTTMSTILMQSVRFVNVRRGSESVSIEKFVESANKKDDEAKVGTQRRADNMDSDEVNVGNDEDQIAVKSVLAPLFQGNSRHRDEEIIHHDNGYNKQFGIMMTFLLLGRKTVYHDDPKTSSLNSDPVSNTRKGGSKSLDLNKSDTGSTGRQQSAGDEQDGLWEDSSPADWMLEALPLHLRSELLTSFICLLTASDQVFELFYEEQMSLCCKKMRVESDKVSDSSDAAGRLVSDSNVSTPTTSRRLSSKLSIPLPPSIKGGNSQRSPMGALEAPVRPLVCEKLMQWVYFLSLQPPGASVSGGKSHVVEEKRVVVMQEGNERFRVLILKLFVTLLALYKKRGVQCVLGANITAPLRLSCGSRSSSTSSDSRTTKSTRSKLLAAFRERNARALPSFKLLVEVCWDSVLALDDTPSHLTHNDNSSPHRAVSSSTSLKDQNCSYYRLKSNLVRDCARLFQLIHSTVCLAQTPGGGMEKRMSLAELTKVAGCADMFTNLLFRVYKQRVHGWVDVAVFDSVMDIYD